ncbi:Triose-phosphate Transporter [Irineochytrium annulatum]|nr:Triose-phosphate Transporter [Irineochytrium annulatum]
MFSGLRWTLIQILMADPSTTSGRTSTTPHNQRGPITALYQLSPLMAIFLAMGSICTEDVLGSPFFETFKAGVETVSLLFVGGFLALCMMLAEFFLISRTNVVTLSVAGIFKEVFMISLAMFVFGDPLTPLAAWGVAVTIVGIAAYTYIKFKGEYVSRKVHGKEKYGPDHDVEMPLTSDRFAD